MTGVLSLELKKKSKDGTLAKQHGQKWLRYMHTWKCQNDAHFFISVW